MSDLFMMSKAYMRRIEPYLPLLHGVPRVDGRRVLSGIIFVIRNGLRRCDAPSAFGPHKTVYNHFIRWSRLGVAASSDSDDCLMVDATHSKAHRTTASLLKKTHSQAYRKEKGCKMKCRFLIAALLVPSAAFAQTYSSAFDQSSLKRQQIGKPNDLLVLGTPHLYGLSASFKIEGLKPLIDRLASWRPELIGIEAVSGPQCVSIRRSRTRYQDTDIDAFCWDPAPAQAATGLDVASATAEAERILADWPEKPAASQRRHLAALFLASGDQASALVQWLRLPENNRHSGDGLDAALVVRLNRLRDYRNEDFQIAAPLAARLGLERLYPIDDHTYDLVFSNYRFQARSIPKEERDKLEADRRNETNKRKVMYKALEAKMESPGGLLAMYRAYNVPGMTMLAYNNDFDASFEEHAPKKFGRGNVSRYWEIRNLRMASHIRSMLDSRPGARALVIAGPSHKIFLEDYVNQSRNVRIVDAEKVLR